MERRQVARKWNDSKAALPSHTGRVQELGQALGRKQRTVMADGERGGKRSLGS